MIVKCVGMAIKRIESWLSPVVHGCRKMPHQDYGESLHNVHLRGLKKSRCMDCPICEWNRNRNRINYLISNRAWIRVRLWWGKQHETHRVRKTKSRFRKSSSFVFIGPILNKIQQFKIPKFTKKYIDVRRVCPAIHKSLSKFSSS